jgi:hypothetical protein
MPPAVIAPFADLLSARALVEPRGLHLDDLNEPPPRLGLHRILRAIGPHKACTGVESPPEATEIDPPIPRPRARSAATSWPAAAARIRGRGRREGPLDEPSAPRLTPRGPRERSERMLVPARGIRSVFETRSGSSGGSAVAAALQLVLADGGGSGGGSGGSSGIVGLLLLVLVLYLLFR